MLDSNTTYSLKVSIANTYGNYDSKGVSWLNFTTGVPPTAGSLTVLPTTGTMFQSNFVIGLAGWKSTVGGNLSANVWGIT